MRHGTPTEQPVFLRVRWVSNRLGGARAHPMLCRPVRRAGQLRGLELDLRSCSRMGSHVDGERLPLSRRPAPLACWRALPPLEARRGLGGGRQLGPNRTSLNSAQSCGTILTIIMGAACMSMRSRLDSSLSMRSRPQSPAPAAMSMPSLSGPPCADR